MFDQINFNWVCGIIATYGRKISYTPSVCVLPKSVSWERSKGQSPCSLLLEALSFSLKSRQRLASESGESCGSFKYLKIKRYWQGWLYKRIWPTPTQNRNGEKAWKEADFPRDCSSYRWQQTQQSSRQFAISYSLRTC